MTHQSIAVLHTNMHRGWGGQANRILNLCRSHQQMGLDVAIAAPRQSELARRSRDAGLVTYDDFEFRRGFRPLSFFPDVARMRSILARHPYDIIDTHGSQDTWVAAAALLGRPSPPAVIRTRHNLFDVRQHLWNRWLYQRFFAHVIASAPNVRDKLVAEGLVPGDRITGIWSGIDTARFHPRERSEALRESLGLPPGKRIIGSVGRLAWEKGHDHLLRAAKEVLEQEPDCVFVILGDGPKRAELLQLRAQLGIEDCFHFAGFHENIPDILALFDLFVLASVSEPMGNAAAEALVTGIPAVTTDTGGLREIVLDGVTGLLVPPGDAAALARAIVKALRDPVGMMKMAQQGREHVMENFTVARLAEETLKVYRKVLGHSEAPAGPRPGKANA